VSDLSDKSIPLARVEAIAEANRTRRENQALDRSDMH
jgi:hypothetical protein